MKPSLAFAILAFSFIGIRQSAMADVFTYSGGVFHTLISTPFGGDCGCQGMPWEVASVEGPQVNNAGQVLNGNVLYSAAGAPLTGVLSVPLGPNTITFAAGLNDLGQIVGTVDGQNPVTLQSFIRGFSYLNGAYSLFDDPSASPSWGTRPKAVNIAGQIIGTSTSVFGNPGFFLETSGFFSEISLPASLNPATSLSFINPNAINNNGEIVGAYWAAGPPNGRPTAFGFLDNNGVFTAIQVPGAAGTTALGINDLGEIVGTYVDGAGTAHGFLDNAGAFSTIDFPGAGSTTVSGINNAGEIVGRALITIPEPAAILLIAIGIAAMGIRIFRPRQTVKSSRFGQLCEQGRDGYGAAPWALANSLR